MHFKAFHLMILKFPVFELKSEGSRLNENAIYNIRLLFSQIRTHPYLSNSASLLNQSSIYCREQTTLWNNLRKQGLKFDSLNKQ